MLTGKHLCWSFFSVNMKAWRPATLLKRDSNIGAFLWILRTSFLQNTSSGCFWKYLMNSLFITFDNNEWCHFVAPYWLPQRLFHFIVCVSLSSISFFSSYFLSGFYYFLVLRYVCQYLKQSSGVVPRFLSGVSRSELLQPYFVNNLPGLVESGKNLSYALSPLAS